MIRTVWWLKKKLEAAPFVSPSTAAAKGSWLIASPQLLGLEELGSGCEWQQGLKITVRGSVRRGG
jgi:hypothetical protein